MSVFTVFFCGTGSNSYDTHKKYYWNGELVSTLADNSEGEEFIDWIVVDGPGSGNHQEELKWVKPGKHYEWRGTILGKGWENNVSHALAMIKGKLNWTRQQLNKDEYQKLKNADIDFPNRSFFKRLFTYPDRKPTAQEAQQELIKRARKRNGQVDTVNLIGWSRGAITCHMLANAIYNDKSLNKIKVNIFAIDPVPGPGNSQSHRTCIPKNVDNYIGIYAQDERSKGFSPTVPDFATESKPALILMRGRHATLVGNAMTKVDQDNLKPKLKELEKNAWSKEPTIALEEEIRALQKNPEPLKAPGILVRDLAEKALEKWGSKFKNKLGLTTDQAKQYFDNIETSKETFDALRKENYALGNQGYQRKVLRGKDARLSDFDSIYGSQFRLERGLRESSVQRWHHEEVI